MQILQVRELTRLVKGLLEEDPRLGALAVEGEISNFKHHSSGHMYFSLKDEDSVINCVMFARQNFQLGFTLRMGCGWSALAASVSMRSGYLPVVRGPDD